MTTQLEVTVTEHRVKESESVQTIFKLFERTDVSTIFPLKIHQQAVLSPSPVLIITLFQDYHYVAQKEPGLLNRKLNEIFPLNASSSNHKLFS